MRYSRWRRWRCKLLNALRTLLLPWGRRPRQPDIAPADELAEEIAAHLEIEVAALQAEGLSSPQAHAAARRAFGNSLLVLEDSRAAWRWRWADEVGRNLRLAWRGLARNRGFAAAAIVTLALGIAACATMFSLVDALLLRPLPIAHPGRMVNIAEYYAHNGGWYFGGVSVADFRDFKRRVPAFSAMTAVAGASQADLSVAGSPRPLWVRPVLPNFFQVLGVRAKLGRTFTEADKPARHARVAILSPELWRTRFAANPGILGRAITLDGEPYTIIGVMTRHFAVPGAMADIWTPLDFRPGQVAPSARADRGLTVFARLAPGVSLRQASVQVAAVMAQLARRYRADQEWDAALHPLNTFYSDRSSMGPLMELLMAATGLLLLLACANIAGLLLARAAARRHELALRSALGAGRGRLLRQLMAESGLLAAGGAALGLAASVWGIRAFATQLRPMNPFPFALPSLDWRVALFIVAVAAATLLLFGLAPAWQASRADPQAALQEYARGAVGGRTRLRRGLVAGQVALALVLLTAAGLLIGGVAMEISTARFGFNPHDLTTAWLTLPRRTAADSGDFAGPVAWARDANAIAVRLRHLPGVTAAATAGGLPLNDFDAAGVTFAAQGPGHGALFYPVSPGYFATMQIPLLRGRSFTGADTAASAPVAIVDRRFVQQYTRGKNPIGQTVWVTFYSYLDAQGKLVNAALHHRAVKIVGVVGPVERVEGMIQDEPAMYFPLAQWPGSRIVAVVRSVSPPSAAEVSRAVWGAAGNQTVIGDLASMHGIVIQNAAPNRLIADLLLLFAILALALAAVGIYGVVAYAARCRTAEIGVRLALGAQRRNIFAMVLREAAVFGGAGWLVGLAAAATLPKIFLAMFGPSFLPTFAQAVWPAAVLIPLAVFAAAYLPARRAAGLDPAQCLRRE